VSAATRRAFLAKYDGACSTCLLPIEIGEEVFYAPGKEAVSGLACCGDKAADELVGGQLPGDDVLAVDDETPDVAIARVLPRHRTRTDMCPTCWQIPANSGACGCHY